MRCVRHRTAKHLPNFLSAKKIALSAGRDENMNELESALRDKITEAGRTLTEARQAGHDHEIHLHSSRIRDLLDVAHRHDIDTREWIDPESLGQDR